MQTDLTDSDEALVERAQRELPYATGAYEALVRRHERLVFGVCLRMLSNRADAEDAYQDVLFKVFNALPRFEQRSSFRTWLMRIAVNACNTALSRRKRRQEGVEEIDHEAEYEASPEIETAAFDVEKLLDQLDADDRQLLVLRFVAEFSFDEIAEVMDLGLSATKMRIYRAVDRLKGRLSEDN